MRRIFLLVSAGLSLASCQGAKPAANPPATTTTLAAGGAATPTPAATADAAVSALLAAERAGDHLASYRLLSASGRRGLDQADWARRRSELPAVTGFRVEEVRGTTVMALVDHQPGLDPFIGLSPAQERQSWRARKEGLGWLVDPSPASEPLFPARAKATEGALAWARAVQSCDEAAVKANQAVEVLFGPAEAAAGLCRSTATVTAGPPAPIPAGPDTQELVGQYGTEAFEWAVAVPVAGASNPLSVVLAPIGSVWKVVGLFAG